MLQLLEILLNIVIVVAVLVVFVGLLAQRHLRAARVFGWFFIAFALSVAMIDGFRWYDKGDFVIKQAVEIWHDVDRESFNRITGIMEVYISRDLASGFNWLMRRPAWLVFSGVGLGFLLIDHFQLQRKPGARPLPLWRRVLKHLRPRQDEERQEA